MVRLWNKKSSRAIVAVAVVGAVAAAGVALTDYLRHQSWLLQDAQTLQPYRHVLFDNRQPAAINAGASGAVRQIADAIWNFNSSQEILLTHLSFSDPRYNLLGNRAHVKVLIVTRVAGQPPEESRQRRVKAVYTFKRTGANRWALHKTDDRTIE